MTRSESQGQYQSDIGEYWRTLENRIEHQKNNLSPNAQLNFACHAVNMDAITSTTTAHGTGISRYS